MNLSTQDTCPVTDSLTIPTTRVCTKCGESLSLDQFSLQKLGRYGRRADCKECGRKYSYIRLYGETAWESFIAKEKAADTRPYPSVGVLAHPFLTYFSPMRQNPYWMNYYG